jgi:23S rRNA maturation-related 3'-5' exoribonuclease YhaM
MSNNAREYFGAELDLIKDDGVRQFTEFALNKAPTYFWVVPSSSTGKYHPSQSNGKGGLVRHTRSAVYFAADRLCRAYNVEGLDRDVVISAVLLHDLVKYGQPMQKYTTKDHDKTGADYIYALYKGLAEKGEAEEISKDTVGSICKAVAFHFGRWTTEGRAKQFPQDYTVLETIVHLADMVSAGKEVNLDFLQESLIG